MEPSSAAKYRSRMFKVESDSFARRVRLSLLAIASAVGLTIAALMAIAIASRTNDTTAVKTFGPVSREPVDTQSTILPVINR
jgi:hypothetical protein